MGTDAHQSKTVTPALEFTCTIKASDLYKEWGRCSMLANYVAAFAAFQYLRREWAENLISTVANDFLEAILGLSPQQEDLTLRCVQQDESLLLEISHGLKPEVVQAYRAFLEDASTKDTDTFYFQLLTSEHPQPAFNQLGFMMLLHDFDTRLNARIHESGRAAVTRVFIPTKELSE